MSYTIGWMGGVVIFATVLLFVIAPWLAAIAVVVATIVVLVGLVGLAAAALASPYLLVSSVRRRRRPMKNTMDPLAAREPEAGRRPDRLRVAGGAHVTAFAHEEPDEAGAILENATRHAA